VSLLRINYSDCSDLNSPERTLRHGQIINNNTFLKKIYEEWYQQIKSYSGYTENGQYVELGSGSGFIKEIMPQVVTSDVIDVATVDKVFSAYKMPFENNSVDGIFMIDVFHHLADVRLFLEEARRVLKKGGVVVMSEPWNCLWAKFIYRNFHHELYDDKRNWTFISEGPLSGANGALPWIVFERDRKIFENEFPHFKIEEIKLHTPFRYLASGGLSFKQFTPAFLFRPFTLIDKVFSYVGTAMFAYIVVRKINN
jgi:SAM-dependent methyltransferase